MKKFLLLTALCLTSMPVWAQTAGWDYTDEQLTFKDNSAYTSSGAPVNGVVKSNMYDYYNIATFTNGKPSGKIDFYANNGTFVGSATLPPSGNTLVADDPKNEEYQKMMASYKQDEYDKNQMRRYVYSCYFNFKDMMSPEGGQAAQTLACEDIVPSFQKNGIGKAESYRARRITKDDQSQVIVETPFIPAKYRPAILMQNGEDGIYVEMQRTGNAIFSFKEKE